MRFLVIFIETLFIFNWKISENKKEDNIRKFLLLFWKIIVVLGFSITGFISYGILYVVEKDYIIEFATEVIADIIIIIVLLIYLIKIQNIKMGRFRLLIYGSITYVCCLVPSIGYS